MFISLVLWCAGCVSDASESTLEIMSVTPDLAEPLPSGSSIYISFDRYLDVEALGGVALISGELSFAAQVGYDPVKRAIVVVPERNLRPALGYELTIPADRIVGLDGATLEEDVVLHFSASAGVVPVLPPVPGFSDVAPIFEQSCSCHGDGTAWPALTEATLADAEGRRQPGPLVVPGAPMASRLLHRLLEDFPGVRGAQMPPGGRLGDDDLNTIIGWIEGL